MKREQHKVEIRKKIVEASGDLFLRKGYSKTTIKDIIKKVGITTGSLYHFFRNKEDILKYITAEMFDLAAIQSDDILGENAEPALRFSLEIALQFDMVAKNRQIGELYLVAYGSPQISELIAQRGADRNQALFQRYNPGFKREDYYLRTLAVKGMLHSFIQVLIHDKKNNYSDMVDHLLAVLLVVFNIPANQIEKSINSVKNILSK